MKTKTTLKILLFTFLIFVFTSHLLAQNKEFAPIGASWFYSFHDMVIPVVTYTTLDCYGDTVLLGINAKKISGGYILYENNKQVFLYQPQINDFTLLYDFNKNTGETWDVVTPMWGIADTFTVIVDSIGIEIINSDTLKVQYIRSLDMPWIFDGKTIEYIGNTTYLFPQYGLADPQPGPLRCYEDSDYTYHPFAFPCDTSYIVGNETIKSNNNFQVYPNPCNDIIYVINNNSKDCYSFLLINHLGKIIIEGSHIFENEATIDFQGINRGIYIMILKQNENYIYQKIIKL